LVDFLFDSFYDLSHNKSTTDRSNWSLSLNGGGLRDRNAVSTPTAQTQMHVVISETVGAGWEQIRRISGWCSFYVARSWAFNFCERRSW